MSKSFDLHIVIGDIDNPLRYEEYIELVSLLKSKTQSPSNQNLYGGMLLKGGLLSDKLKQILSIMKRKNRVANEPRVHAWVDNSVPRPNPSINQPPLVTTPMVTPDETQSRIPDTAQEIPLSELKALENSKRLDKVNTMEVFANVINAKSSNKSSNKSNLLLPVLIINPDGDYHLGQPDTIHDTFYYVNNPSSEIKTAEDQHDFHKLFV